DHGAEILVADGDPQFKITSDVGEIKVNGNVESFEPLKYNFGDVRVSALLDEVARVFAPETKMSGKVGFAGKVEGTGPDYRAEGAIESDAVSAEGLRIAGIRIKSSI